MTTLTDYALAGVTGWLAWSLFQSREAETARSYWAAALMALAIAAMLGGTYHGFAPTLPQGALYLLWKATILAVGIGTFGMIVGSAIARTTGTLRKFVCLIAVAKLVVYSGWIVAHDDFIYVIADSGIAMAMVGALHARTALRQADRASIWILGGIAVAVFAAIVQASDYRLRQHFGHNDLYHVIQIVAMWLLYRGARQLSDRPMSTRLS